MSPGLQSPATQHVVCGGGAAYSGIIVTLLIALWVRPLPGTADIQRGLYHVTPGQEAWTSGSKLHLS